MKINNRVEVNYRYNSKYQEKSKKQLNLYWIKIMEIQFHLNNWLEY